MGFTLNQLEQERQIRKLQKKEDKDTSDYEKLSNLPKINNVELKGDKTTNDLGINADNVMMSDGVTSVEDAVDKLKANTMIGADTLSFDTEYTASSDGYVRGIVNHGSDKFVQIMLYFSNAAAYGLAAKVGDSPNENQACVVYVRKGMKYKVNCSSVNDATCTFIPIS